MGVVSLPLSRGKCALIDESDVALVSGRRWHAMPSNVTWYARSSDGVYLHRLLTECPDGLEVDHVNHNGLDNRRANLRVCTHTENMRNGKFALATQCPKGHPYYDGNTYRDRRGRRCKRCNAERQAMLRATETPEQRERRTAYFRAYFQKRNAS
jgi:hypothetical protein